MIRIENSTEFKIDSVQLIYDVTIYNYATISSNEATHYHLFKSLPDDTAASFNLNAKKIVAGRLFPPNSYPYPILPSGNYTLRIFADSFLVAGYNAEFIKQ